MRRLIRLALAVSESEIGLRRTHLRRRMELNLALVVAALVATVCGLVLGFLALKAWLGLQGALGALLGLAILACLLLLIAMRIEDRAHARRTAAMAAARRQILERELTAAVAEFDPAGKVGTAALVGLGAVALYVFAQSVWPKGGAAAADQDSGTAGSTPEAEAEAAAPPRDRAHPAA